MIKLKIETEYNLTYCLSCFWSESLWKSKNSKCQREDEKEEEKEKEEEDKQWSKVDKFKII